MTALVVDGDGDVGVPRAVEKGEVLSRTKTEMVF